MVDLHKEGFLPLIQVHDELDVSIRNKNEIKKIKEIMENAVELSVPSVVDYNIGQTWGAAYEKKGQTN
jgi:DNA polymerase I-like protein with 3'-5' exonuclease and polymerase domains